MFPVVATWALWQVTLDTIKIADNSSFRDWQIFHWCLDRQIHSPIYKKGHARRVLHKPRPRPVS